MSDSISQLDEVLSLLQQHGLSAASVKVGEIEVCGLRDSSAAPPKGAEFSEREMPTARELLFRHTQFGAPPRKSVNDA